MVKKILSLGAGVDQVEIIKVLQKRNCQVLVIDQDPAAPGAKVADKFFSISTIDKEKIKHLAAAEKVDRIAVVSTEKPLLPAAKVSESLRLPFPISSAQAKLVTSKKEMKRLMMASGISTAPYAVCKSESEVKDFYLKNGSKSIIVKPVDSSGSRGVRLYRGRENLSKIVAGAISYSTTGECLAETYLKGVELSVDAVSRGGQATVLMVSRTDTMKTAGKVALVTASVFPSGISTQLQMQVDEIMQKLATALGLKDTLFFAQMIVCAGEIKVLEYCARNAGGSKINLIKQATGLDLMEMQADIILDGRARKTAPHQYARDVIALFLYAQPGVVGSYEILRWLKSEKVVSEYQIYKPVGSRVSDISDRTDRLGVAFITGKKGGSGIKKKLSVFQRKIKIPSSTGEDLYINTVGMLKGRDKTCES